MSTQSKKSKVAVSSDAECLQTNQGAGQTQPDGRASGTSSRGSGGSGAGVAKEGSHTASPSLGSGGPMHLQERLYLAQPNLQSLPDVSLAQKIRSGAFNTRNHDE